MSYVESQLLPGEKVRFRAHLHKIIFFPGYFFGGFTILLGLLTLAESKVWPLVFVCALLAGGLLLCAQIIYSSSEFAVTERRVIIKVGWIKRRTLETMLPKVEALGVDQGLLGRLLNFGTITVTGTGGTKEQFHQIANPLEFRKHVQAQAMAADDRRSQTSSRQSSAQPSILHERPESPRDERECPFCAERILVKAKICRYCGRDVPLVQPN